MASSRAAAVLVVVLLGAVALAGCTKSLRQDDELGAAFVKRSCTEVTDRASTAVGAAAAALALPNVALAQAGAPELVVGTLFGASQPGSADLVRAVDLAADQINAPAAQAPVLHVRVLHAEGGSVTVAAFDALVDQGAEAVVVAPVTDEILDRAVQRKVVVFAPADTDPAFTLERNNQGYFFRMTPSAALEGETLADMVWQDGCRRASVLAPSDSYGKGLGDVFRRSFQDKGGTIVEFVQYAGAPSSAHVAQAARDDPDAIVLVGTPDDGAAAVKAAFESQKMKKTVWYFTGGLRDRAFVDAVGKAENTETRRQEFVVAGLRGTAPEAAEGPAADAFAAAWQDAYPQDADGPAEHAAEAYDAVMVAALAAARTTGRNEPLDGDHLADHVRDVANEDDANDVDVRGSGIRQGLLLASTGGNLDYVGAGGPVEFDRNGDPETGSFAWWKVNDDGTLVTTRSRVEPGKPPQ